MSKRQAFMNIPPDKKILQHLDHMGLGYVSKGKTRTAIAKKYSTELPGVIPSIKLQSTASVAAPYPFNRGPKKVTMITSARTWQEMPSFGEATEVALIGRSNVGKSTLLNALLGYTPSHVQKAAVSNKPGQTRQLQFFSLGKDIATRNPRLVVVDMPGYGFAFMNKQDSERCFRLSSKYLRERGKYLKRVLLVLDARHGFKYADIRCLRDLISGTYDDQNQSREQLEAQEAKYSDDYGAPTKSESEELHRMNWKIQVVLTKCDLVERQVLARRIQLVRKDLTDCLPMTGGMLPVVMVSGLRNKGIVELQREIASLVPPIEHSIEKSKKAGAKTTVKKSPNNILGF